MHPDGSIAMYVDSTGSNGENERLVGSSLAVFLGIFGAHRIYLGTSPKVAVVYGLTFGGFGVLVLLDLGHLIFSKDLAPYRNNERVIMWGSPKEQLTPQ
jgi:TM2 domain-containing membrane protein YozV